MKVHLEVYICWCQLIRLLSNKTRKACSLLVKTVGVFGVHRPGDPAGMIRSLNHPSFIFLLNIMLHRLHAQEFVLHFTLQQLNKPTLLCPFPLLLYLLLLFSPYITHTLPAFLFSKLLPSVLSLLPSPGLKATHLMLLCDIIFAVWRLSPEQIRDISYCCLSNCLPCELCIVLCIQCWHFVRWTKSQRVKERQEMERLGEWGKWGLFF